MPGLTVSLPMLNLRAGVAPGTLDEEKRTIEVVWTTGARGLRSGFWESYYEELAIEPENVRLDHFIGAPVLDQHNHGSVRDISGVVEEAWPVKSSNGKVREWRARIRIATRAEEIFEKIREGVIRAVSVGYFVGKYEELEETVNKLRVLRAVDWSPAELSLVTVPFDAGASVRSMNVQEICTVVTHNRSTEMPNITEPNEPSPAVDKEGKALERKADPAPVAPPAPPAPAPAAAETADAARSRAFAELEQVRRMAAASGFKDGAAAAFEGMLAQGGNLDDVRAAIVDKALERQKGAITDTTSAAITVGADLRRDGVERGIAEVILARANPREYGDKLRVCPKITASTIYCFSVLLYSSILHGICQG